jgi:hypothetical protein
MSASQQKRNKELHAQIASLETRLAGAREELRVARSDALEEAARYIEEAIPFQKELAADKDDLRVSDIAFGKVVACELLAQGIRALAKGSK